MIVRKLGDVKPKVLLFQGSPRDKDTCPNMESKSHKIVQYISDKWSPFVDFEIIDLAVNQTKAPTIQPCKGCVSSSGGFHCHFKCSCYFKGDSKKPDLLQELDVYEKLKSCDGFLIVSPIHWHSLTSQVKLLFDRLVCINQTLTVEDAEKLMGKKNIKDANITGKFARSGRHNDMLRNHLEGKFCGFYAHGDNGANDYAGKELPDSYSDVIDDGFGLNAKAVVMPYVMQMKYSGVYVPDELIQAFYINEGIDYNTANKTFNKEKEFFDRADKLIENLLNYFDEKDVE